MILASLGKGLCPNCMSMEPEPAPGQDTRGTCSHCGGDLYKQNPPQLLPVGTVLDCGERSYHLGAVLGQGGFGVTYIGYDPAAGRKVAVKEYFPTRCAQRGEDGRTVEPLPGMEETYAGGRYSFVKEARVLSELEGMPSVVQALAYVETNNTAYLIMEYLDGTPLYRMVDPKTGKRIPAEKLLPPLKKLLYDISRLHDKKVIHRDIAPDNIMWMPDGSLKLLDFGSARSMEDGKSMTVMLKHGFAPVEQYQSHGQGTYTDVYAMAATIYYCLTAVTPPQSTERMLGGDDLQLKRPTALGVALAPEEEDALLWGLEVLPQNRPQTMGEFAQRLFPDLKPLIVQPQPAPQPQSAYQPRQQGRLWFQYGKEEWRNLGFQERMGSLWPLYLACALVLLFGIVALAWLVL